MGESGCVSWMFEKKSVFQIDRSKSDEETLMDLAMEAGADDMRVESEYFEILASPTEFETVRSALDAAGIETTLAEITYLPKNTVELDAEKAKKVLQLLEDFEDQDDVQNAYANFDIPDDVMEQLAS